MHSEDPAIKSARRIWDQAKPSRRLELLRAAGYKGLAHAYRKFNDLDMIVKIDLNFVIARNNVQEVQHEPA